MHVTLISVCLGGSGRYVVSDSGLILYEFPLLASLIDPTAPVVGVGVGEPWDKWVVRERGWRGTWVGGWVDKEVKCCKLTIGGGRLKSQVCT